jgi:hypothetical protein
MPDLPKLKLTPKQQEMYDAIKAAHDEREAWWKLPRETRGTMPKGEVELRGKFSRKVMNRLVDLGLISSYGVEYTTQVWMHMPLNYGLDDLKDDDENDQD